MKLYLPFLALLLLAAEVHSQQHRASVYFKLGFGNLNNNNYERAIDHFERAIQLDSTGECGTGYKGTAYSEIGFAYMRLRKYDSAMLFFDRSLELDSTIISARQNKAIILTMHGLSEQAINEYSKIIAIKPDNINAYVQRGFLYNTTGQKERANEDFKQALYLNSINETLPIELSDKLKSMIEEFEEGK